MSSTDPAAQGPPSPSESSPHPITFSVKSSNDTKYTITFPQSTTVADLKIKLAELSEIPKERQRLIYSGRVMKDEETLEHYRVQSGHTVHMVKGAASNASRGGASGTSGASGADARPVVPPNIAAGTGHNPLAGLTGARYAGHVQLPNVDMFGPDGGMGPPPDPEQLAQAMSNPQFQATMNEMLQNPQLLDYIISSNPMLQQLGPEARQMMQSDIFRQMVSNPEIIRSMSQFGSRGFGGMGGAAPSFPEPGRTDTTPAAPPSTAPPQTGSSPAPPTANVPLPLNPFANLGANPFAPLFGAPPPRPAEGGAPPAAPDMGQNPLLGGNPMLGVGGFPLDQAALRAILGGMGGLQGGAAPSGNPGLFGNATPAPPPDTRPPEERYADQLRQLNDMGFYDFDRNIHALRRSGGSVQGAINELLNG